jgi:hypothetical protein
LSPFLGKTICKILDIRKAYDIIKLGKILKAFNVAFNERLKFVTVFAVRAFSLRGNCCEEG